jgi:hypothetical protein
VRPGWKTANPTAPEFAPARPENEKLGTTSLDDALVWPGTRNP